MGLAGWMAGCQEVWSLKTGEAGRVVVYAEEADNPNTSFMGVEVIEANYMCLYIACFLFCTLHWPHFFVSIQELAYIWLDCAIRSWWLDHHAHFWWLVPTSPVLVGTLYGAGRSRSFTRRGVRKEASWCRTAWS